MAFRVDILKAISTSATNDSLEHHKNGYVLPEREILSRVFTGVERNSLPLADDEHGSDDLWVSAFLLVSQLRR